MRPHDLLKQEAEHSYVVTEALFRMVDARELAWKPTTGRNWMTLGNCSGTAPRRVEPASGAS